MKRLLALAAVLEAVTGLALMIAPAIFTILLMRTDVTGAGVAVGRVAGFALFALGLACWPNRDPNGNYASSFRALLAYNFLVACYLISLGIGGEFVGVFLWPGVAIHAILTLLLILFRNS